jgi:hypothetical protein
MKRTLIAVLALLVVAGVTPRGEAPPTAPGIAPAAAATPHTPTMAQFMSAAFPKELVAAANADRIAWIANDKGMRNVFTAAAPDFRARRVTPFMKDDGVDTTQLSISADGTIVTFTAGPPRIGPDGSPVPRRTRTASSGQSGPRLRRGARHGVWPRGKTPRCPLMADTPPSQKTGRSSASRLRGQRRA